MSRLCALSSILAGAVLLLAGAPGTQTLRLDRLAQARPGDRIPPGWEAREVGDAPPAESRVVGREGADPWLRVHAEAGEAAQLWLELDEPLDPGEGRLSWRWRVDTGVAGARLREPDLDDSPARLFVVFGEPGMMSPPRTIFYSWGGDAEDPGFFRSHVSDRLAVLTLRGAGDSTGVWLEESRRPGDDFREAFGEEPPEIRAVGFMIDTDQTGAPARSGLAELRWSPGG